MSVVPSTGKAPGIDYLGPTSGYRLRGLQGQVIDALGQAIVGGRYKPGDILPREAELIQQYGVSRTSIREAMKVLAAKGLVEIRQRVGTTVRPQEMWSVFDSDLLAWHHAQGLGSVVMRDLVELRQILEPSAAKLAAGRATMTDLRRLERAQAEMFQKASDNDGYAAADVEFHLAVYATSHNALLQRFGRLVADFMRLSFEIQQRARDETTSDFSADAAQHQEVYRSINRGDSEAAFESMLQIVLEGKSSLIEALGQLEEVAGAAGE